MSNHQYWMQQCLLLAEKAKQHGEVPVGAILVGGNNGNGNILGEGWNQPISQCDPTAHAEVIALRVAATKLNNYRLPNTRLYVTIEPCAMCVGALIHARVAEVIFGAREPRAGAICSNLALLDNKHESYGNHSIAYTEGILAEQCSSLMTNFFKQRR